MMMRKTTELFFVFSLISFPLLAAPAVPGPSAIASADQNRIGIVAAVRGTVKIETSAKVGREVKSGMPIYLGDTVSTDEKGNLQIMLLDQTVFTIGPNSAIVIDKFIYDPASHSGQVNAKVVKGVFRFVTGKIGQKNPDAMNVDLPAGTIGIRGTIVAGQTQGQRSFVVLLGPGERNNTRSRQGRIIVGNTVNGKVQAVVINRSGFGTVIENGEGSPSQPFRVPAEMMQTITSALGSTSSEENQDSDADDSGTSGSESPTEQSGQDTAVAELSVDDAELAAEVLLTVSDESSAAAQNSADDENFVFDGISTFGDLGKIQTGQYKYEQTAVKLYDTTNSNAMVGSYNFLLNIDFGARTVGGPNSTINGNLNTHAFAFALETLPFGGNDDFASYTFDDTNSDNSAQPDLELVEASILFLNNQGDPGSSVIHAVEIQDNTSPGPNPNGEGAGIANRQPV